MSCIISLLLVIKLILCLTSVFVVTEACSLMKRFLSLASAHQLKLDTSVKEIQHIHVKKKKNQRLNQQYKDLATNK